MAVQLPPNSTGTVVATATSGGKDYQQVMLVDATTPTGQGATLGTAAALSAESSAGAQLFVRPGDWSVNNIPAAASAASVSRAAGAAGVRHVCTSIAANLSTVGTAQAVPLVLNLRDGATGAGTILWSQQILLGTNASLQISLSGLNIVGSAATAMTLEFAANNVAASFTSVALTGYDTPAA